jgi:hypothetical protein
VELLKKETGIKIGAKIGDREIKGSIDLFEFFLDSSLNVERDTIEQIVTPLRAIQGIRSYGVAHRRGSGYITLLKKYNLQDKSNSDKVKTLINNLVMSLNIILKNTRGEKEST